MIALDFVNMLFTQPTPEFLFNVFTFEERLIRGYQQPMYDLYGTNCILSTYRSFKK